VKDVERHRTDDTWEGDNGEQVGRHGSEPPEDQAQKYIGTPSDQGLAMCLMACTERTLFCTLQLYFCNSDFKMNTDMKYVKRNKVMPYQYGLQYTGMCPPRKSENQNMWV
jgi:hypothetical protein